MCNMKRAKDTDLIHHFEYKISSINVVKSLLLFFFNELEFQLTHKIKLIITEHIYIFM